VANLPDFNQLYEAYKRGDPAGDSVQLHYLAQIPDLSRAEFIGLAEDIERLAKSYSDAARKELTLGQLGYFLPSVKQAIAEKPFKPSRDEKNEPIDLLAAEAPFGDLDLSKDKAVEPEPFQGASSAIPSVQIGESPLKQPDAVEEDNLPVVPIVAPEPIQTTSGDMLQASESEPMQTPPVEPASRGTRFLDWMQRGADALGVIDQTGVTDLANSTVSFTRAAFSRDDNQQREHLINAGVSMVSAIPIVGDAAKLWKYNRLAQQSAAAGGGVNAAGQPVSVAPVLQTGGAGGNIPPVIPPATPAASLQPGGNQGPSNPGFFARMFGGGNANPPQTQTGGAGGGVPPVVPPGNNGGGGFFGNNISQLFGGNAAQGGSGYFANGGGFFGGGGGVNAPGAAAASQIPNRVMNAVNQGVQGIAGGAAALGMTIPGLQPFAAALGVGTEALNQFNAGIEAVDRTNQAIIEGNRELAQLSGGLAGSYVNYDARTFQRDIDRSKDMEGVLPDLLAKQSDFADAQQDLYGPYAQLGVVIQTQLTVAATTLVKILDFLEPFGEIIRFFTDQQIKMKDPFAARNAMEKGVNDFIFGQKNPLVNPGPVNRPRNPGEPGGADGNVKRNNF
jgi:hypothetical protein